MRCCAAVGFGMRAWVAVDPAATCWLRTSRRWYVIPWVVEGVERRGGEGSITTRVATLRKGTNDVKLYRRFG